MKWFIGISLQIFEKLNMDLFNFHLNKQVLLQKNVLKLV